MKYLTAYILGFLLLGLGYITVSAQEAEIVPVEEVIIEKPIVRYDSKLKSPSLKSLDIDYNDPIVREIAVIERLDTIIVLLNRLLKAQ